jgi:hypothetical protein
MQSELVLQNLLAQPLLTADAFGASTETTSGTEIASPIFRINSRRETLNLTPGGLTCFSSRCFLQPLFADRGHIHHKLLELGFSQRQVVLILYVVSAVCGLLSLFLLYPSGSLVGIVLFVIGAGVWVGVQHLGYHEFLELGWVAHRTMEQKRIIVNDLTIRRATEALSRSKDMEGVGRDTSRYI